MAALASASKSSPATGFPPTLAVGEPRCPHPFTIGCFSSAQVRPEATAAPLRHFQ